MTNTPILTIRDISLTFKDKKILHNLSFSLNSGQITSLLGHNGAGKTTLFHVLIGALKSSSGSIHFDQKEITSLNSHMRGKLGIGYLSQQSSLFPSLTVKDNLLCILDYLVDSKKKANETLEKTLVEFNLSKIAYQKASNLSGGEKRRCEIARALLTEPKLLLLDEPFANIDPITIMEVKKLILDLKKRSVTTLITDHNAKEIFSLADHHIILKEGTILAEGSSKKLSTDNNAKIFYLGNDFSY